MPGEPWNAPELPCAPLPKREGPALPVTGAPRVLSDLETFQVVFPLPPPPCYRCGLPIHGRRARPDFPHLIDTPAGLGIAFYLAHEACMSAKRKDMPAAWRHLYKKTPDEARAILASRAHEVNGWRIEKIRAFGPSTEGKFMTMEQNVHRLNVFIDDAGLIVDVDGIY